MTSVEHSSSMQAPADTELVLDVMNEDDVLLLAELEALNVAVAKVLEVLGKLIEALVASEVLEGGGATNPLLVTEPVTDELLDVELVRLTGNCMVGVVGRPSALPERECTGLVLAAGTTDDSELEDVATAPAAVWYTLR